MSEKEDGNSRIICASEQNWMIQLARACREANRVIVREFQTTSSNLGFVRTVALENGFLISAWDENLIMEKAMREEMFGSTPLKKSAADLLAPECQGRLGWGRNGETRG
jgi:hypothetical protein